MADRRRTRGRSGSTEFPSSGAVEEQLSGPDGPPSSSPTATPSACLDPPPLSPAARNSCGQVLRSRLLLLRRLRSPGPFLYGGGGILGGATGSSSPAMTRSSPTCPSRRSSFRSELGREDGLAACGGASVGPAPTVMKEVLATAGYTGNGRPLFFLSSASSTPQRGENWKSLLRGLFHFTIADGLRQLGRHRMKGACS
jgi:hypothetical protein